MNKRIKLNVLKASLLSLPTEDKGKICKELIKKDSFTLRGLAKELGMPHTTVHHWIKGREGEVIIGIDRLIQQLKVMRFKRADIFKLKKIIEIAEKKLNEL